MEAVLHFQCMVQLDHSLVITFIYSMIYYINIEC